MEKALRFCTLSHLFHLLLEQSFEVLATAPQSQCFAARVLDLVEAKHEPTVYFMWE